MGTSLKLPSGDSDYLHGSGSTDFSVWINAQREKNMPYGKLAFLGALGFMVLTPGNILPDQQRHFVGFGSAAIAWSPWPILTWQVQLNGHTSFYKESNLREINAPSAQIILGGTINLRRQFTLDLGLAEDLIVKTSPDVVFHLSGRYSF